MDALSYEYLIRAAFNCERTSRHGADADIYRGLEHRIEPIGGKPVNQYELGVRVGEITNNLYEALCEVIDKHSDNSDFVSKIQKCKDYLYEPTFEKINSCIKETWDAFHEIGLVVR